ncbi:MAG: cupin domain-containing protein [Acidobacteria bacterium]|nr:cupin domain-containing protein [Acidobacteriota bacterium]
MKHRVALSDALKLVPTIEGKRFAGVFRHQTLEVEIYAPRGIDSQNPHTRDEVYIVISGKGQFLCDGEREPFGPGDFLFAPAGAVHRFEDFTEDLSVWVIFYGPEGGEKESSPGLGRARS